MRGCTLPRIRGYSAFAPDRPRPHMQGYLLAEGLELPRGHTVVDSTLGRFPIRLFAQFSLICVIPILFGTATSQVKSSPTGRIFRNEMFGLTYIIPGNLAPSPDNQLPQDPTGREKFVLALWDNPRRTPVPHVVFMYDTKVSG